MTDNSTQDEKANEKAKAFEARLNDDGTLRNPEWQSDNVSTNDSGKSIEDVSPIFEFARRYGVTANEASDQVDAGTDAEVVVKDDATLQDEKDEAASNRDDAQNQAAEDGSVDTTQADEVEAEQAKADEAKAAADTYPPEHSG